ncbi:MAG: hypothetical protein KFF50_15850, partial [Desulfatitalea sp.]|nr:hypothetical protein [Desulfatitalea sp.]
MIVLLLFFASGAGAQTIVPGGTISVDTIWTLEGSPYVVTGSVTVQGTDGDDGVTTLTIEPGVEVRFNSNRYLQIGSTSGAQGALVALGEEGSEVRFTTNSVDAQPGQWQGIWFYNTTEQSTTRMEHCIVEYASGAVRVMNAKATLVSCRFANNSSYDLYYTGAVGGSVYNCSFNNGINFGGTGHVAFDNNQVYWNESYPVSMPADNVGTFVATTSFHGLGDRSALQVTGNRLSKSSIWKASVPYVITSGQNYFIVQGTDGTNGVTTLTIEPGAEIRFNTNRYLQIGSTSGAQGALVVLGEEG